jgi:hypothetical protein
MGGEIAIKRGIRVVPAIPRQDVLPILLVACTVIIAYVWNSFVGLSFKGSLKAYFLTAAILGVATCYYWHYRPQARRPAEILLYVSMWLIFPWFATRLTYLGIALGMPVEDQLFLRADSVLGLDWKALFYFLKSHPVIIRLLILIYQSTYFQPIIAVPLLAIMGPLGRNQQFVVAMCISLFLTIVICALLPAYGPMTDFGITDYLRRIVDDLQNGHHQQIHVSGIICFPSFHTVMAILFTWVYRGMRAFWPAALINGAMLISIPTLGNHYFVDVLGGAIVALIAIMVTARVSCLFD